MLNIEEAKILLEPAILAGGVDNGVIQEAEMQLSVQFSSEGKNGSGLV